MLGHDRGHVGPMVLDGRASIRRQVRERLGRPAGRSVVRVGVGHDAFGPRRQRQQVGEPRRRGVERPDRSEGLDVAVMLAEHRHRPVDVGARPTAGVLQVGPGRQRDRPADRQADRQRRIPPGPPDRQRTPVDQPHHRVVARCGDRPVVPEHRIGQRPEKCERPGVVDADRLAGVVGRGEHERLTRFDQETVERRRGQHHPQHRIARRHRRRDRGVVAGLEQHDGPSRRHQQFGLVGVDMGQLPSRGQVGHQHRERLVGSMLAGPQAGHRGIVGGVAGQVVATDPFDRHRLTGAEATADLVDGRSGRRGASLDQRGGRRRTVSRQAETGPAVVAGDRLGVVPTVVGVAVFLGTARTQREAVHRRARPVVGEAGDDRVARAAVGAGDEGVPEPTVGRIVHLRHTGGAGGGVGRDQGHPRLVEVGLDDAEPLEAVPAVERCAAAHERQHHRQRRRVGHEAATEVGQLRRRPLGLDHHPAGVIRDGAPHPEGEGEPMHEGSEPDPLHDPADLEVFALTPHGHHGDAGSTPPDRRSHRVTRLLPESATARTPRCRAVP